MAKWARLRNDVAVDVTIVDPAVAFPVELASQFIAVPDDVVQGSRLSGNSWVHPEPPPVPEPPPPPPPPPSNLAALKAERKAALAERRWLAETGGAVIAGIPVATDVRSQSVITGAALAAVIDENYSVQWKTSAGFVTLTREMVIGLATGVRQHVQACFDREAELVAEIEVATTTAALAEIDINSGWPS